LYFVISSEGSSSVVINSLQLRTCRPAQVDPSR
jgi:hypothetical protein